MRSPASWPRARGAKAIDSVHERGLDVNAATDLVTYLGEQREATRIVPNDTQIVVERFRDELGDWRLVVHSPYGTPVHAPWALAINARLRGRLRRRRASHRILYDDRKPPGAKVCARPTGQAGGVRA